MTPREEAIADCKYAKGLGDETSRTALFHHINLWLDYDIELPDDIEYGKTILEIVAKLDTEECLLKE